MTFTNTETLALQVITMISSSLSVSGCSIVLYKLFTSNPVWNLTNKQLLILCVIDLVGAVFWGIGHYWEHGSHHPLCELQVGSLCIPFSLLLVLPPPSV
jgi:hypothetical protein